MRRSARRRPSRQDARPANCQHHRLERVGDGDAPPASFARAARRDRRPARDRRPIEGRARRATKPATEAPSTRPKPARSPGQSGISARRRGRASSCGSVGSGGRSGAIESALSRRADPREPQPDTGTLAQPAHPIKTIRDGGSRIQVNGRHGATGRRGGRAPPLRRATADHRNTVA